MKIYAFADESSAIFDEQILAMKRNGLDGLEIRGVDGVNISEISVEKAHEIRAKMDAAQLVTWSIGSPIGKINIATGDFDEHLNKFRHTIEIAKILGAENIRMFSFFIPKGEDPEQYKDEVIRRLKIFAEIAQDSGITLCHENEKGIYGDNALRCLEILQAVPEIKGIFDPANFVQCGQDTLEAWDLLKNYIKYMHIKDALPDNSVVPAGKGAGNVAIVVKKFRDKGGNEVTIEPHLAVFKGLKDLEEDGNTSEIRKFVYRSNEEAFDAACDAFKQLIARKIRLGIIGVGKMGSGHAKKILAGECPDIELIAVADHKPTKKEWVKDNFPENIVFFDDAIAMLDSGLIDSCVVCTPHYDHPKLAVECMKRGIHVMVEKPAGVYTKQVREMNAEAAKHQDVVFGMMFNQRTNCVYRKMRELIKSGKYGNIRRTNWLITNWYRSQAYYDSGDWRATWSGEGGGVLLNQCPHQLDLWQWICGMPVKVNAQLHYGKWHDIEVEDDVTAYVEYENGATGVFITSTGDAYGSNRFEVQMDKAKLVVEGNELKVWEFEQSEQEFSASNTKPFGSVKVHQIDAETDGENPQHMGVFRAWSGAILHGTPMVADGTEGINGLMLSNAMHMSAFLGKTVELPIDEDAYYEELMKRVATSKRKGNVNEVTADTSSSYAGTK